MFLLRVWFLIVQLLVFQVTKEENSAQNPIAGCDICRTLLIFQACELLSDINSLKGGGVIPDNQ